MATKHQDEQRVVEYLNESDKDKKTEKLCLIRNMGIHLHNCQVLREQEGKLIVAKRPGPKQDKTPIVEDYGPCQQCYGYYVRSELWRHKCPISQEMNEGNVRGKKRRQAVSCKLLLPPPKGVSQKLNQVLHSMKADAVSRVAKSDHLILALGEKLYLKVGHDKEQHGYIRTKMRELARLLIHLREQPKKTNSGLVDFISPDQYKIVQVAARSIAGYDDSSNEYKAPSLVLHLGHLLKKCARIAEGHALEGQREDQRKAAKRFLRQVELNWTDDMAVNAHRNLEDRRRNNPKLIPLTSDVKIFSKYLGTKARQAAKELQESQDDVGAWDTLKETTLALLILFNRRRQGEVSKLQMDEFLQLKPASQPGLAVEYLSDIEKRLCKFFYRLEVPGKRGRTVPILINGEMNGWLELISNTRKNMNISSNNVYFFARSHYGSEGHVRGSDCLRVSSEECGASHPKLLRSTRLRKHIATMTQILNLKEHELDILARFLGHDIRVHREYYRLPETTLQVAKVSKLLLAMEAGGPSLQLGQSLDDIVVNPNEGRL